MLNSSHCQYQYQEFPETHNYLSYSYDSGNCSAYPTCSYSGVSCGELSCEQNILQPGTDATLTATPYDLFSVPPPNSAVLPPSQPFTEENNSADAPVDLLFSVPPPNLTEDTALFSVPPPSLPLVAREECHSSPSSYVTNSVQSFNNPALDDEIQKFLNHCNAKNTQKKCSKSYINKVLESHMKTKSRKTSVKSKEKRHSQNLSRHISRESSVSSSSSSPLDPTSRHQHQISESNILEKEDAISSAYMTEVETVETKDYLLRLYQQEVKKQELRSKTQPESKTQEKDGNRQLELESLLVDYIQKTSHDLLIKKREFYKKLHSNDGHSENSEEKDAGQSLISQVIASSSVLKTSTRSEEPSDAWMHIKSPNRNRKNPSQNLSDGGYSTESKKRDGLLAEHANKSPVCDEGSSKRRRSRYDDKDEGSEDRHKLRLSKSRDNSSLSQKPSKELLKLERNSSSKQTFRSKSEKDDIEQSNNYCKSSKKMSKSRLKKQRKAYRQSLKENKKKLQIETSDSQRKTHKVDRLMKSESKHSGRNREKSRESADKKSSGTKIESKKTHLNLEESKELLKYDIGNCSTKGESETFLSVSELKQSPQTDVTDVSPYQQNAPSNSSRASIKMNFIRNEPFIKNYQCPSFIDEEEEEVVTKAEEAFLSLINSSNSYKMNDKIPMENPENQPMEPLLIESISEQPEDVSEKHTVERLKNSSLHLELVFILKYMGAKLGVLAEPISLLYDTLNQAHKEEKPVIESLDNDGATLLFFSKQRVMKFLNTQDISVVQKSLYAETVTNIEKLLNEFEEKKRYNQVQNEKRERKYKHRIKDENKPTVENINIKSLAKATRNKDAKDTVNLIKETLKSQRIVTTDEELMNIYLKIRKIHVKDAR